MKDNVTYSVVIEEFDSEMGGWKPYTAEDVQARTNENGRVSNENKSQW